MGGDQGAEQQRRRQGPSERQPDRGAEEHRQREGQRPEGDHRPAVDPDERQVELDPGDEHQVEQAELAEVGDGGVAGGDQVEAIGADDVAADQQADDPRDPRPAHQRRPDDHDDEEDEELPGGAAGRFKGDAGEGRCEGGAHQCRVVWRSGIEPPPFGGFGADPFFEQVVDPALGLKRADRRVDGLAIRRARRQRHRQFLLFRQLGDRFELAVRAGGDRRRRAAGRAASLRSCRLRARPALRAGRRR